MNMWKRSMLQGVQIGNCCFYSNSAVFKEEICGTLFKRYLHKNEALHTPKLIVKRISFLVNTNLHETNLLWHISATIQHLA